MQIFRHYGDLPAAAQGAVVTIGNFDGVHRGHQALIAHARAMADRKECPLAALVFEPHPQEFFRPEAACARLTPFRTKARLLAQYEVEVTFAFPFDREMVGRSAENFVEAILADALHVKGIVVGADFRFGKDRAGDAELLKKLGASLGFECEILAPLLVGKAKISSSDIRAALREARPDMAAELLGHWWTIEGRVEHGDSRGRALGYPTANLRLDGYLHPAFGVYAIRASVLEDDRRAGSYLGVASLGVRPMFPSDEPLLEVFLFDFTGELYGKHLAVELIDYLRPELTFSAVEELKRQMAQDANGAREALERRNVHAL